MDGKMEGWAKTARNGNVKENGSSGFYRGAERERGGCEARARQDLTMLRCWCVWIVCVLRKRGKKRRETVTEQLSKATGCFKLHLCSRWLALALLPGHADD